MLDTLDEMLDRDHSSSAVEQIRADAAAADRYGFTIVELLVVVTIITILLAMLSPALSKSIYQAQLAVCGANLHATHGGVITYTFDHKRFYPNRKMMGHGTDVDPIKITGANAVVDYDDRKQLQSYVQVGKTMLCPVQQYIDLEIDSGDDTYVYTGYAFWWGWRFAPQGVPRPGLERLGDRLEFDIDPHEGTDIRTSTVLAADHLQTTALPGATFFYSTHPEKRGQHVPMYRQSGANPWAGTGAEYTSQGQWVTISWSVTTYQPRSSFDVNYIMIDGGVVPVRDFRIGYGHEKGLVPMPTFKVEWDKWKTPVNPVPPQ